MNTHLPLLVLIALLSLPSCASKPVTSNSQPLPAEALLKSPHCGATTHSTAAIWISDLQSLEQQSSGFTSSRVTGKDDLRDQLDLAEASPLSAALNQVDFANYGVLLVSMGRQPTAGYGLGFESGSAQLKDGTLEVTLSWAQPMPGYFVAQMLTSPCVLLKLPALRFRKIRVLDQKGQLRVEATR